MGKIKSIEDHLTVIRELNIFDDSNVVYAYLAGSLMEGFGNETSDVDVFIICKSLDDLEFSKQNFRETIIELGDTIVRNINVDNVRYDFEYFTVTQLDNIINKLNNLNFNTDKHIEKISTDSIDLIHRLKFAVPLLNHEKFFEFRKNINFNNLDKYLVITHIEKYDGFLEDLEGALSAKDWGTAYTLTKLLLKTSVNAYLAKYGETNPGEKWIYRKLLRYSENNNDKYIMDEYYLLDGYCFNGDSINTYVQRALKFTQKLIFEAQTILR